MVLRHFATLHCTYLLHTGLLMSQGTASSALWIYPRARPHAVMLPYKPYYHEHIKSLFPKPRRLLRSVS